MHHLRYSIVVLSIVLSFISATKARAQWAVQKFDDRIMLDIEHTRTPQQTGIFLFLSHTYMYGEIAAPAGLLIGGVASHNQAMRQNSLYVASSELVNYGFTQLLKHVTRRRRPFIQNTGLTPVYRAASYSFPSGHTSATFTTAFALSAAYPKWYVIAPSFLWAGSVAYSRMYLGVHYPSDVAGGIGVGAVSAFGTAPFLKK